MHRNIPCAYAMSAAEALVRAALNILQYPFPFAGSSWKVFSS